MLSHILTEEQKGCRKRVMGCKEQITIDAVILEQARKRNRNLNMAYIDYQKAFDSIPHSWLLKTLEIYNVDPQIVLFLRNTMRNWQTKLSIKAANTISETQNIKIKRGIFQGDSLSALWFCLALNPISRMLTETGYGFTVKAQPRSQLVSHLFYMDDLKLYAANNSQLQTMLRLAHQLSQDIGMTFGVKKCQTVTVERGRLKEAPEVRLDQETVISSMSENPYRYLGILQTNKVEHQKIKEVLTKEFEKRLRNTLKSRLNSNNLTKAINSYAIPVLQYSFGIVKWSHTDLEGINRKIRTELTKFRKHHPRSSIERVTLPRDKGGRGIIDVVQACQSQIDTLRSYFRLSTTQLHRAISQADQNFTPLHLNDAHFEGHPLESDEDKLITWGSKQLHGRFQNDLKSEAVDLKASLEWLRTGTLYPETEGFMLGIQDQVVNTRNYQKYIIKADIPTDSCRKCSTTQETVEHILSACQSLASSQYLERHNKVAIILYLEILKAYQITPLNQDPYYKYKPPPVVESEDTRIYWDKGIITDQTVNHNRPDITVVDKKNRSALLIDVSIPSNNNMENKYAEKIRKYTDLKREVKLMWDLQEVRIVPIIITTMGLIPKNLKSCINTIGIPWNTYRLMQKSVILDATHIVRSFLET